MTNKKAYNLKQAWLTEKTGRLTNLRKYVFIVDGRANKSEIKKTIELIYGAKIKDINIINIKGKRRRLGKSIGRVAGFKKAIVTLKEGEKIENLV